MSSSALVDYGCNICYDLPVVGRRHLHLVGDGDIGDYVGVTLPETNMAPENWWLEDEFPFGLTYFQGRAASFREGQGSDGFVMFCQLQAVGGNLYDISHGSCRHCCQEHLGSKRGCQTPHRNGCLTESPKMSAPPAMRPAGPVSISGAPVPVTVSSGVPMQVVSKSAAYPAGAPVTYYRPPTGAPGAPAPGVTYPAGYVGTAGTVPQGRVVQAVTPSQAPVTVQRIVRTSAPALPLSKAPAPQATRPNTVGGPAYSQSAYETKHEKDEQLQNLKLGKNHVLGEDFLLVGGTSRG